MKPDSSLDQTNSLSPDAEVMLFDGWDYTPVRFPLPQSAPSDTESGPAPAEVGPAS